MLSLFAGATHNKFGDIDPLPLGGYLDQCFFRCGGSYLKSAVARFGGRGNGHFYLESNCTASVLPISTPQLHRLIVASHLQITDPGHATASRGSLEVHCSLPVRRCQTALAH